LLSYDVSAWLLRCKYTAAVGRQSIRWLRRAHQNYFIRLYYSVFVIHVIYGSVSGWLAPAASSLLLWGTRAFPNAGSVK